MISSSLHWSPSPTLWLRCGLLGPFYSTEPTLLWSRLRTMSWSQSDLPAPLLKLLESFRGAWRHPQHRQGSDRKRHQCPRNQRSRSLRVCERKSSLQQCLAGLLCLLSWISRSIPILSGTLQAPCSSQHLSEALAGCLLFSTIDTWL